MIVGGVRDVLLEGLGEGLWEELISRPGKNTNRNKLHFAVILCRPHF